MEDIIEWCYIAPHAILIWHRPLCAAIDKKAEITTPVESPTEATPILYSLYSSST